METSKPYENLLCDIALMNWYQGYSWRSEILQIRICLRVAESKLSSILQIMNVFLNKNLSKFWHF